MYVCAVYIDTEEARQIYEYIQPIEIKQELTKSKSLIINENNINCKYNLNIRYIFDKQI